MDFFDFTLSMARSERALRVAEAHERPGKYAQHELVDATRAWRHHPSNVLVGDEGAVEDRIVTAGSAHAQGAPRLGDGVTLRGTQQKCVHDFRRGRITCVHAMDAEECPDGRETAEELVAIKTVAPGHALGARRRQQHRKVVARLGVTGGENLPIRGVAEEPFQRVVTRTPEVRGDARPVDVHVDGYRRGRRVVREAPLLATNLDQCEPAPTELLWNRHRQVSGRAQILEVFGEEPILAVVYRRAFVAAPEQLL